MSDAVVVPEPARHHLVPKFYLRRFANSERRTLVLDRNGARRMTAIKRAAVVTDFYAIDDKDGQTSQELEKAFGLIESAGARIMQSVLDGTFPPRDRDRLEFAGYMALQSVRGHAFRRAWEQMLAEEGAAAHRNFTAKVMVDNMPRLTNAFLRMRWRLCRFEQPCLFTGDQPVSYWRRGTTGRFFTGIAPLSAQEVRFPLSPDHALVLTWKGTAEDERIYEHDAAVATTLNEWTARWCETELYCHPDLQAWLPDEPVAPLPSSVDPAHANAVVMELQQHLNWRQAAEVAEGPDWHGPNTVHGVPWDRD